MSPGVQTGWFIISVMAIVAVYDYFAHVKWGWSGTISGVISRLGKRWPLFVGLVAFAAGVLFGHWFFGV